jgi:exodeoxyribonuclease VII large subunit
MLPRLAQEVDQARVRMFRALDQQLTGQDRELAHLRARARALSPLATLDRGYAVVVDPGGAVVRSADQLSVGDSVRVRVSTGHFRADVTDVASAP